MDRMLYIAMSGAKETMLSQAVNTHNLANASTTGFKASFDAFVTKQIAGVGHDSRAYALTQDTQADFSHGTQIATGNPLDVAVMGDGWITVQAPDGMEAFTRAGDLRVNEFGLLVNGAGHPVMGNDGPITVPPFESLEIAGDGTITIRPLGQDVNALAIVNRIKLVRPENMAEMVRGADGLVRQRDGQLVPPDGNVRLATGMLESSNVNAVNAMVNMIALARRFEMQVKMMDTAQQNDEATAQLMRMT